jgi:hypothetical protein
MNPFFLFPIFGGNGDRLAGGQTLKQKRINPLLGLPLLVGPDQFADIFADAAITASRDPLLNEMLHRLRQGDIHGIHNGTSLSAYLTSLAIIVNPLPRAARQAGAGD